jgi:hypothetical protein
LIDPFAINATGHARFDPTLGIPERFGIDSVHGVEREAPLTVQRGGGRDEPRFIFPAGQRDRCSAMGDTSLRPLQDRVSRFGGTVVIGIEKNKNPAFLAALGGGEQQVAPEFLLSRFRNRSRRTRMGKSTSVNTVGVRQAPSRRNRTGTAATSPSPSTIAATFTALPRRKARPGAAPARLARLDRVPADSDATAPPAEKSC